MGHTREEQLHVERQKLREDVSEYYRAKNIVAMLQRELGIKNLPNVDPWKYRSRSMREMAQLLRRSLATLSIDRNMLGLTADIDFTLNTTYLEKVMKRNKYNNGSSKKFIFEIMGVDEFLPKLDNMLTMNWFGDFIFPKYHRELVVNKGIGVVYGSSRFRTSQSFDGKVPYSGPMLVCHAREIKADWLAESNVRAFRVVVIPTDKDVWSASIGYAVRSTITDEIKPAFGEDIAKAVSLCNRRVKSEVMKQMGI